MTISPSNDNVAEVALIHVGIDSCNRVLCSQTEGGIGLFEGPFLTGDGVDLSNFPKASKALGQFRFYPVSANAFPEALAFTVEELEGQNKNSISEEIRKLLTLWEPVLIQFPYLSMGENDYIYRFRNDSQRNKSIYRIDADSQRLYDSPLCAAIKELRRKRERTAEDSAILDFGGIRYHLPSHFGFCLGVQNAIERAYETLVAYPDRRVFMLSELIHNPFVNEDLLARGLRYLQTDKGVPLINPDSSKPYWDELTDQDVVIIPAFGATNEDKVRLIRRGLPIVEHDATCMLVEKVWKAARNFGKAGYTVIIHGKAEHEETKATFSNSARYAPSLILRNLQEASLLADVILERDPARQLELFSPFKDKASPGFDPSVDLQRIAVVNQTTLLRNETLGIIDFLEEIMEKNYGKEAVADRIHRKSRGDTLCYATQVNQDALGKALETEMDAAIVVGGKNSSNTFQLFRICQSRFGEKAFYIQSEKNIQSADSISHYCYDVASGQGNSHKNMEKPFLPSQASGQPINILITGGASCPDGIIQQVIERINSFFPNEVLRTQQDVLERLLAQD